MENYDDNGRSAKWKVVDLFSGAGGMSFGFHTHKEFEIIGSVDAQLGKPSSTPGSLQCNSTYEKNIGLSPLNINLKEISPKELKSKLGLGEGDSIDVLSSCPPCTGFSRANPQNHLKDDPRNSLVAKTAQFAIELDASIVVMENARELLKGNFTQHFNSLREQLEENGYKVHAKIHFLNKFGLPQVRERALVIAVKKELPLRTLSELWSDYVVAPEATTVLRTFNELDSGDYPDHKFPNFSSQTVKDRIAAIPADGGSWIDLLKHPDGDELLTPGMKRLLAQGKKGSFPDTYGRMHWDKPAPTIKRECSHIGNGRYAHPEENRLCSVREMATLQGFPYNFKFNGASLSNLYRHIGDAVPPLISHQLAHVCNWILTGQKPKIEEILLPFYHLKPSDITQTSKECQTSMTLFPH